MDSSRTSTACSSPHNDTVEKIIKNDHVRYIRKGYGLIMAIIIATSFFTIAPAVLKAIYPKVLPENNVEWFASMSLVAIHIVINLICYLGTYFIYIAKSPFLEQYRVLNKPWPWESNPEEWRRLLKDSIKLLFINQFLIAPLLSAVDTKLSGIIFRVDTESMPSTLEVVLQIAFCMVIDDFCFYWVHRLLHRPFFYRRLHKIHHRYNHTISIATEYAHPIEFIFSNVVRFYKETFYLSGLILKLTSFMGPKLLGRNMHLITAWLWVILRISETVDGHCGYEFSWSPFRLLPLSGSSIYHNYHHHANVGNYGSFFTYWDTLCKTNSQYFVWLAKRQRDSQFGEIKKVYADLKKKLSNDPNYKIARADELNTQESQEVSSKDLRSKQCLKSE